MEQPKRYMLIACAVLYRECYYCAALSRNVVDVRLCEKGLSDAVVLQVGERGFEGGESSVPHIAPLHRIARWSCSQQALALQVRQRRLNRR